MSEASVRDPAFRRRILPKRTKIAFSSGALEEAMVSAASITTMLFYNQVLGVSAALCGTAFFIASVVDGISDPRVGGLSETDPHGSVWAGNASEMTAPALGSHWDASWAPEPSKIQEDSCLGV